jgi:hypothetical protein
MPEQHDEQEQRDEVSKRATPKNRRESEREEEQRGEVVQENGGSGAPQGGQIHGRQGDQQGMKR